MAFTHEYPYTNAANYNDDWLLNQVKQLGSTVDALNERYASLQKLVDEANAYTDSKVSPLQSQIDANKAAIEALQTSLNQQVATLKAYIDAGDLALQTDINTKYLRHEQKLSQMWEDMKAYIAEQQYDLKVRNFFTGAMVSVQSMFDYLAQFHIESAGTYETVSGQNTYTHYAAKNKNYEYVVLNSGTFFAS